MGSGSTWPSLSEDQNRFYRELDEDVFGGYLDTLVEGRDGAAADGATEAVEEYEQAIDQLVDARHGLLEVPSSAAGGPTDESRYAPRRLD